MPPTEQPPLPLTLANGEPLPDALEQEAARHSGTRFFQKHESVGRLVLQLLEEGVGTSEIARVVGPYCGRADEATGTDTGLRKLIERFGAYHKVKLGDVIGHKAAAVASGALERMLDVVPKATAKELGALSMAATQAHTIHREAAGISLPPIRHEHVHVNLSELRQMAATAERQAVIDVVSVEPQEPAFPIKKPEMVTP
jgi:hypothetical protein